MLGVSQQGFFSIFPLALHLYRPSFCFTHIVSLGSAPRAVVANAIAANVTIPFIIGFYRISADMASEFFYGGAGWSNRLRVPMR